MKVALLSVLWLAVLRAPSLGAAPLDSALVEHILRSEPSQVGDWVTYEMRGGAGRRAYWRISVVGEELDRFGRQAHWLELEVGPHELLAAPLMQMRWLVAQGTGMIGNGVTRLIVAIGSGEPREVSPSALSRLLAAQVEASETSPAKATNPGDPSIHIGDETRLMTYVGTLAAVPIEVRDRGAVIKRLWISSDLPILHLAKLEIPGAQHAMEVKAHGSDARPQVRLPDQAAEQIRLDPEDRDGP